MKGLLYYHSRFREITQSDFNIGTMKSLFCLLLQLALGFQLADAECPEDFPGLVKWTEMTTVNISNYVMLFYANIKFILI